MCFVYRRLFLISRSWPLTGRLADSSRAPDKVVSIAGLQRIMVQTMNAANAVPHFGFCEEIVVDELVQVCAARMRRVLVACF